MMIPRIIISCKSGNLSMNSTKYDQCCWMDNSAEKYCQPQRCCDSPTIHNNNHKNHCVCNVYACLCYWQHIKFSNSHRFWHENDIVWEKKIDRSMVWSLKIVLIKYALQISWANGQPQVFTIFVFEFLYTYSSLFLLSYLE